MEREREIHAIIRLTTSFGGVLGTMAWVEQLGGSNTDDRKTASLWSSSQAPKLYRYQFSCWDRATVVLVGVEQCIALELWRFHRKEAPPDHWKVHLSLSAYPSVV